MKRCTKCGVVKPVSDFYKAPGTRDGHRNDCKPCNLEAQAARTRANPEVNRMRVRLWREANPDRVAQRNRQHRDDGHKRVSDRKSYLKRKYGLTIQQYDTLLAEQGGGCAICGRKPRPDISLHVDHDHKTGALRGILCFRCNNALGDFDDDAGLLQQALCYLLSHQAADELAAARERVRQLIPTVAETGGRAG